MADALRTTYCVPQMGSKFARLACGTKRRVLVAAPCATAGADNFPVTVSVPAPATAFRSALRSMICFSLESLASLAGLIVQASDNAILARQAQLRQRHDWRTVNQFE